MDLVIKFYIKINLQVRDAVDVTSRAGDVVLQRTLVRRERETVMDLVTEDNMMDMQGVRETWSVVVTTARSSEPITTLKMIAVRSQIIHLLLQVLKLLSILSKTIFTQRISDQLVRFVLL